MKWEARTFQVIPLTPVHVGSGGRLSPEDYELDRDELVCLDTRRLLRALNEAGRREFSRLMDQGDIRGGQKFLRDLWRQIPGDRGRSRFERYRTRIGVGAREELRKILLHPERKGEVFAVQRNSHTGEVCVPGSALKGALRTALVNAWAQMEAGAVARALREAPPGDQGRRAQALEEAALGAPRSETERDPLRLVQVSDINWPAAAVQVDRATLYTQGKEEESLEGIQVHLERLLSAADEEHLPEQAAVTIRLAATPQLHRVERKQFARELTWQVLAAACNRFFEGRREAEKRAFPWLWDRAVPPGGTFGAGDLLVRVGRFCHFDSLSVDGYRSGWNMKARQPITGMGASRMWCESAAGIRAPFGWVRLRWVE